MRRLLPAFDRHQPEAEIIGRLVTGYGELEFGLAHAVGQGIGDPDAVIKAMFKERGELKRVNIARDLGRTAVTPDHWKKAFEDAVDAMHHCREIRNQYAHCVWLDNIANGLSFVQLEEIARDAAPIDLTSLTQHVADLELLREQFLFFSAVDTLMGYLSFEAQFAAGRIKQNPHPLPVLPSKPSLKIAAPVPTPLNTFQKS